MKNKTKIGSALVYGLVIMSMVLIILTSILQFVVSQIKYGFYEAAKEESLQIAEAGIYFYRWYLAHEVEGRTSQQIKDFWDTGNPLGVAAPYEVEYKDPYGAGIGKYKIEVTAPDPYSTIVVVKATGWTYKNPNSQRSVQVRFRRPSWSEYAVLANVMGPDVKNMYIRFGPDTDIAGPIHANGGVHFDGIARNTVTSAQTSYTDDDAGFVGNHPGVWTNWAGEYNSTQGSNVFLGGKEFPVPPKDFTSIAGNVSMMKAEAIAGNGRYFNNQKLNGLKTDSGRRIKLKADGTFDICAVMTYDTTNYSISKYYRNSGSGDCGTCSGQCLSNYPIPDNGIIFVEGNVWIDGIIDNKKVSVVAANIAAGSADRDVYVGMTGVAGDVGDLKYTNHDGKDIIGLVAQRNISVVANSKNDLMIEAALLAQLGKVGRNSYSGNIRNSITINGSIATNLRYGFAYVNSSGVLVNGYQIRNIWYDNNLLYYPPPYFPTGTEYSLDLWEEL